MNLFAGIAIPLLAATTCLAGAAVAQELRPCDELGLGVENVIFAEVGSSFRRFFDGRVTFVLVDTIVPERASAGVAILFPDPNTGNPTCEAVVGFAGVDLDGATSRLDQNGELTVSLPTLAYNDRTGRLRPTRPLRVTISLAEGSVQAR